MNQPLRASFTRTDENRNARLLLAWIAGDKPAFDLVLDETVRDPVGVPGLIFSLTEFTTRLGQAAFPDGKFVANLQGRLAASQQLDAGDEGEAR